MNDLPRNRRLRSFACIALLFGACEGTTWRCDPTLSFSTVPPGAEQDGSLGRCGRACTIEAIALGARHTCVSVGDFREVACFGANESRQSSPWIDADEVPPTWLWQRTDEQRSSEGLPLAAGALATCVVIESSLVCWGSSAVLGGAGGDAPRRLEFDARFQYVGAGEVTFRAVAENTRPYSFGAYDPSNPLADPPLGAPRRWREGAPFHALGGFFAISPYSDLGYLALGAVPPPGPLDRAAIASQLGVLIDGAMPPRRIAIGAMHACTRVDETRLDCGGDGDRGQLGHELPGEDEFGWRLRTVDPPPMIGWSDRYCVGGHLDVRDEGGVIVVGERRGGHTCAIDEAGVVWCWGANDRGQVGDGTTIDRRAPVPVAGLPHATAIDCGGEHTCAVAGGELYCWGDNRYGQLGVPSSELTLRPRPDRIVFLP